jgi:L-ascorbate metabolism protein UlaG (beta-lactamase superfamily)
MASLVIEFLGHSSFALQHPSSGWVIVDPWISGNPACKITLQEITEAHYVLVSHGHRDHLGDAVPICLRTDARLISTPEICAFASRHGVAYEKQSYGLNIGGTARFDRFAVTMVQAFHTSDIQGPQYSLDRSLEPGSGAVGFVLDFDGEHRIYYTGDTGVFSDMKLIAELYAPDLVILPIGGKFTMGPKEAAKALELMRPARVIPCHYDTFPNQRVDIEAFRSLVRRSSPNTELIVLQPGQRTEIAPV